MSEVAAKNHSYLDLIKTPQLRKITLVSGTFWYWIIFWKTPINAGKSNSWCYCAFRFAVSFLYYGISFRISGFGVDMYLTQFIYGLIEVPAKIITFFVLNWIGRRNGQAWFLIVTGALIGINAAIPLGDIEHCSSSIEDDPCLGSCGFDSSYLTLIISSFRLFCSSYVHRCGVKRLLRGSVHHSLPLLQWTLPDHPQVKP